jgi:enamine deaminase RidA (YjgF/YER057c/UK114 family)
VQLRIYLAPDKDGKIPWTEWFESYNLFFNNEKRPAKVVRTTLAVHSLAWPDILVEIKAVAVKKRAN